MDLQNHASCLLEGLKLNLNNFSLCCGLYRYFTHDCTSIYGQLLAIYTYFIRNRFGCLTLHYSKFKTLKKHVKTAV